jgi:hypothetical protein
MQETKLKEWLVLNKEDVGSMNIQGAGGAHPELLLPSTRTAFDSHLHRLAPVKMATQWVCCSYDGSTRRQRCYQPCFGNGHLLLLHGFQQRLVKIKQNMDITCG